MFKIKFYIFLTYSIYIFILELYFELFLVHSPLLEKSLLVSFPSSTHMLKSEELPYKVIREPIIVTNVLIVFNIFIALLRQSRTK